MTDKSVTQRLDDGTRDAVNDFFDALSKWRDEVASSTERYSKTILAKMVPAATAMGWPKEVVEASSAYLTQASKIQLQMIDQFMDAWQAQAKSPMSSQFMAQLQPYTGTGTSWEYRLRQCSFGWRRHRRGSEIGHLRSPCGPMSGLAITEAQDGTDV